nr:MAG TPA: hypothetical protein [Microviridae sp.]
MLILFPFLYYKDRGYLRHIQIILYVIQHKIALLIVSLLQISDEKGLNRVRCETRFAAHKSKDFV